jgi:4-hydroxyphenylpyruvate dioxygenase
LGFNGWISAELFNESLTVSNPEVPEQHAKRAAESWKKIEKDFNTVTGSGNTRSQRRLTNDMSRAQL